MSKDEAVVLLDYDDHGAAGRIARITFNNPAKHNALGLAGKDLFVEIMTGLKHDESLRAVILTGAGDKSFVGGSDLAQMAGYDLAAAEASATKTHRACDAVRQFPVPVIARINGYCFGSGMEIAACADMRAAADHARFGMPEVRFGIPSGMEASVLPRLIGWGKATELVLTGDHIDAAEAYRLGGILQVVPKEKLRDAAMELAAKIASKSPKAVELAKWSLNGIELLDPKESYRYEQGFTLELYASPDSQESRDAFVEKRDADFEKKSEDKGQ